MRNTIHRISVCIPFLLNLALAQANEITLKPYNLIAIDSAAFKSAKGEALENLIRTAATAECRLHLCGKDPCVTLISEAHETRKDEGGSLTLFDMIEMSDGSREPVPTARFEVPKENSEEDQIYFTSIRCKNDNELDTKIRATAIPFQLAFLTSSLQQLTAPKKCESSEPPSEPLVTRYLKKPGLCYFLQSTAKSTIQQSISFAKSWGGPLGLCAAMLESTGIPNSVTQRLDQSIDQYRVANLPQQLLSEAERVRFAPLIRMDDLKGQYKKKKEELRLLPSNQQMLEALFEELERMKVSAISASDIVRVSNMSRNFGYKSFDEVLRLTEKILKLPTDLKVIDEKKVLEAQPKLEKLLVHYDENLKKDFAVILNQIVKNSRLPSSDRNPHKTLMYFEGEPGTGKTYAAEGIAAALGLPYKRFDVSTRDVTKLHEQLEAFLGTAASKNAIIFIDEVGEALRPTSQNVTAAAPMNGPKGGPVGDSTRSQLTSYLLPILEPDAQTLESNLSTTEYKVNHDIGNAIIIMASNFPIVDDALRSRIRSINFEKLPLPIRSKLKEDIVSKKLKEQELNESDLTDEDQKNLNLILQKSHENEAGVRVMKQVLNRYLEMKKASLETPALDLFHMVSKLEKTSPMNEVQIQAAFDDQIKKKTSAPSSPRVEKTDAQAE